MEYLPSELSVRKKLSAYINGHISISQFNDWFAPRTWNAYKHESKKRKQFVFDILLRLAEFSHGHCTEADLKNVFERMLASQIVGSIESLVTESTYPSTYPLNRPRRSRTEIRQEVTESERYFKLRHYLVGGEVDKREGGNMSAELPMAGERAERCEACRWWVHPRDEDSVLVANCHRYPPIYDLAFVRQVEKMRQHGGDESKSYVADTMGPWIFPITCEDWFCGEWAAKPTTGGGGG